MNVRLETAIMPAAPDIHTKRSIVAGMLAVWCAGAAWAQAASAVRVALPTLKNVEEVRRLTEQQAQKGYPVHLRAVVTYSDRDDLFVQDETAGIWVNRPRSVTAPAVGDWLDLEGVTAQPDFAPDIMNPHWRRLGQAPLPEPRRPTFDQMASSAADAQWVEVEGTVRSARMEDERLRLSLAVSGGKLLVELVNPASNGGDLVGAAVRIRGVCGTLFNSHNQIIGIVLRL